MSLNPGILLVQLDDSFNQRVCSDLGEAGYTPIVVTDLSQAVEEFQIHQPLMVVISRHERDSTSLAVCRQLRQRSNTIIIVMMINQETVEERVACLEAGADDYLLHTNHSQTLLKLVSFYLTPAEIVKEQLQFGDVILDLTTRQLFVKNKATGLTMKEFELLKCLMSYPREVLTREQILENVWGDNFQGESNVIEVYIRYLRLKIEREGHKRLIHTVRGVGYVLREG
ncbi:MAG: response regulator transcription factor [Cyanobacteria bacterium P01_G01_bin.49]